PRRVREMRRQVLWRRGGHSCPARGRAARRTRIRLLRGAPRAASCRRGTRAQPGGIGRPPGRLRLRATPPGRATSASGPALRRAASVVTASLDESALCEVEGSLEALLRAREEQQCIRPRTAGRNFLCKVLEDRRALREVSGGKVIPRRLDPALSEPVSCGRRGQANCELGQLRGRGRSA